jgi:uncharacterized membrane protein
MNARVCARRAAGDCAWLALLPGTALAEAADDIHDIRGPKAVPGPWVPYALLAAAAAVALCAYLLWRRRQRAPALPTLSLPERTLQRLDAMRPLMRPETARAFGIAASELIRDYIEKRFNVVATQRTTEEFLQALLQNSDDALARHRALLAEFLHRCDLVKFAGDSLAVTDMESLFLSARRFVLETREAGST